MGLLSKGLSKAGIVQEGGHAIERSNVFDHVSDGVTPTSEINWQVSTPTVVRDVKPCSRAEAEAAEKEASDLEASVKNGVRLLKAETNKQQSIAKLTRSHRQYMGATAQAHFEIAGANRGLAGKLHGLREGYAQLGFSLQRKEEDTNTKISNLKQKLLG